jgi:23S rRNA (guanosine2251-2'-O)-methyltransferase
MSQLIYGRNAVKEWLSADLPVDKIWASRESGGSSLRDIESMAEKRHIRIYRVPRSELDERLGSVRHQGIAAEIRLPRFVPMEKLIEQAKQKNEPALLAVLDGIQDPHNVGAIIRSAEGAGVHGVIIPKDRAAGLTPGVLKASAGAAAHIPVARVTNLVRTLEDLKKEGLWIIGADQGTSSHFEQIDYTGPVAIVLGAEGKGMRRLVKKNCDFFASIPMYGKINSLNVSVSAALFFFEARTQRSRLRSK